MIYNKAVKTIGKELNMNTANTKSERNHKTLKKLSVYASIVTGGALGVLLCYKAFEYLFTLVSAYISAIG